MSYSFQHYMIFCIVIAFIVLLYIISNKSSYSLLLISGLGKINQFQLLKSRTFTSNIRPMISNSFDYDQFFIFSNESPLVRAYLDIVRDTICGLTLQTQERAVEPGIIIKIRPMNIDERVKGEDWPVIGITMVGQRRLINIEWALRLVIANEVQGDFIECGVWRGGSSIFARAVLKALNITDRHVWLADSFQGLPKARTKNDNDQWSKQEYLKVPLEEVQTNFRSFDLLDDHVHFCKGYFVDSLPRCNVSQLAVLRMDGDMYESTMDQLFNLYSKLQVGGVIIIDDYNIEECKTAIYDFRDWHNITEQVTEIPGDRYGRYWIKEKSIEIQMDRYKPLLVSTTEYTQ